MTTQSTILLVVFLAAVIALAWPLGIVLARVGDGAAGSSPMRGFGWLGKIEQLLQEYARSHPSEPKYDLDFICGVALTGQPPYDQCYHVNFMAATKSTFRNTLFFAEFRGGYQNLSKTSICCPLPQPYDMGKLLLKRYMIYS
jgi:hypothetical protein